MEYRKVVVDGEERWMRGDRLVEAPVDYVEASISIVQLSDGSPHELRGEIYRYKTDMTRGLVCRTEVWIEKPDAMTVEALRQFLDRCEAAFTANQARRK